MKVKSKDIARWLFVLAVEMTAERARMSLTADANSIARVTRMSKEISDVATWLDDADFDIERPAVEAQIEAQEKRASKR